METPDRLIDGGEGTGEEGKGEDKDLCCVDELNQKQLCEGALVSIKFQGMLQL